MWLYDNRPIFQFSELRKPKIDDGVKVVELQIITKNSGQLIWWDRTKQHSLLGTNGQILPNLSPAHQGGMHVIVNKASGHHELCLRDAQTIIMLLHCRALNR